MLIIIPTYGTYTTLQRRKQINPDENLLYSYYVHITIGTDIIILHCYYFARRVHLI